MDVIDLPIVDGQSSLGEGFSQLRARDRSALLIRRRSSSSGVAPKYALATAGDLVRADRQAIRVLENVVRRLPLERQSVYMPTTAELHEWKLNLVEPHLTWSAHEQSLDAVKRAYSLVAAAWATGIVISRHERGIEGYSIGPVSCYCPNDHPVAGPPPERCEKCGEGATCGKL